ncbi:hypothetical protein AJ79_05788 [Helicocarpus griseus UAMH5409]|uniref:Uncharacterized protein n=1 Tax=Helicocarpus griseus UAMH5409 TaxID=1447875 RepID=A0A2B7XJG0_9EURO|nr:hypothetical protein AJ79_05788 [Helicocarpus griseus UAMH5409]
MEAQIPEEFLVPLQGEFSGPRPTYHEGEDAHDMSNLRFNFLCKPQYEIAAGEPMRVPIVLKINATQCADNPLRNCKFAAFVTVEEPTALTNNPRHLKHYQQFYVPFLPVNRRDGGAL